MPLPNEPIVKKHQEELFEYNSFMCQHCVSLNVTNEQLLEIGKEIKSKQNNKKQYHNWIVETEEENKIGYLDISSVQLRRIFSRNSLKKHGRFYGGWWQSLPSKYRRHIMIDDKKTVEVDTEKFETNQKGIYAVGDICNYPGKLKLILSGFHEGALAARACFKLARPNEKYRFEFTTSSKAIKNRLGVKSD